MTIDTTNMPTYVIPKVFALPTGSMAAITELVRSNEFNLENIDGFKTPIDESLMGIIKQIEYQVSEVAFGTGGPEAKKVTIAACLGAILLAEVLQPKES